MNALAEGLTVTIVGMGITLLALLALSYILDIFGAFSKAKPKAKAQPVPEVSEEIEEVDETDDLELVAVITAAIAASLNTTTDQLQVRSFRRVGVQGSTWSRTAKQENLKIIE
ncbi:MAG: OadG family protein [Epulopiscium sp.]|nr:OadG family protein [Candidatus Epulonipiscium sp.]